MKNLTAAIMVDETVWTVYPDSTCVSNEYQVIQLTAVDALEVPLHLIEALTDAYRELVGK